MPPAKLFALTDFRPGRLLHRQLQRHGLSALQLREHDAAWIPFLQSVDRAYEEARTQEKLFTRADELATEEMQVLNQALQNKQDQLSEAHQDSRVLQQTLETAGFGAFTYEPGTKVVTLTPRLSRMLGLPDSCLEISLARFEAAFREESAQSLRYTLSNLIPTGADGEAPEIELRPSGDLLKDQWLTCRLTLQSNLGVAQSQVLGVVIDTTRRHSAEQRALALTTFDQLTQLYNRQHFFDIASQVIASDSSKSKPFALLFLDLDGFKEVNDSMGHSAGDQLLQVLAKRLQSSMPPLSCLARFGGDEFLMMIRNVQDADNLRSFSDQILKQIASPITIGEAEVCVSGSLGATFYPRDGETVEQLLQNADTAMYQAKAAGRNNCKIFSQSMNSQNLVRFAMISRLRRAIAEDTISVAFQPLMNGADHTIFGVEALARWTDAELGAVAPSVFIPLAESCGLIEALGQAVFRKSLHSIKAWEFDGCPPILLSVNFSALQFTNPKFLNNLSAELDEANFSPERLQIEITETVMLSDSSTCAVNLKALRTLGVRVSIDDFGTGYSSLAYLKRLPIDSIKIDRSFVIDLVDANQPAPLLSAMIALGESLGMAVLVEGIETDAQRQAILKLGCKLMQGYFFHRPMSANAMRNLLLQKAPLSRVQILAIEEGAIAD
jgi:diguanylate cyclase (GGDEF)-like protein